MANDSSSHKKIGKETFVNHPPAIEIPEWNTPLVSPLYHSVKYSAKTMDQVDSLMKESHPGYFYSRVSNPTVRQLELVLAELQGKKEAICLSSGIAAVTTLLFSLLKSGDHIIFFIESYKPTRTFIRGLLAKFGVTYSLLSIRDLDLIEKTLSSKRTRLVIFESPTNPMTFIADIEAITFLCRKHGALSILDNTFAGLHQHHEFDIDFYLHSLTKFAGGHGDAMGGAIIGNDLMGLKNVRSELGPVMDPHSAFLILRGLKTYFLRYQQHSNNASLVASFLSHHPKIEKTYYPGLMSHPQFHLAQKQMKQMGAIISIGLKSDRLRQFIEKLKLFTLTASLGSTESLVTPIELFFGGDLSQSEKLTAEINDRAVRFAIGIENSDDLISDLEAALEII